MQSDYSAVDRTELEALRERWQQMRGDKQATLAWWQAARYGMFIHWGLYAIPAGQWHGKTQPGIAEWIMWRAQIPRDEYAALAEQFQPDQFDAAAWVNLAKNAGMKYIVITSKHHDGFAMYRSQVNPFNVVDATPFRRDPIAELAAACREADLRLGLYYSHSLDWRDGGDTGRADRIATDGHAGFNETNLYDPSPWSFSEYLEHKSFPQLEELLRRFPDTLMIWYDVAGLMPAATSFEFYRRHHALAPQALAASRISSPEAIAASFGWGDFDTLGDNEIPAQICNQPWETVGTLNNSWGFKQNDNDWKSPTEVLFWLVEVVSKGGNYMLNVGPTAAGLIPGESIDCLEQVGAWLGVNGEAIYDTTPWRISREGPTRLMMESTAQREADGFAADFTGRDFWFTRKENTVFVISLAWPDDGKAVIASLGAGALVAGETVTGVRLLGAAGALQWTQTAAALQVTLPPVNPNRVGYAMEITLQ